MYDEYSFDHSGDTLDLFKEEIKKNGIENTFDNEVFSTSEAKKQCFFVFPVEDELKINNLNDMKVLMGLK